jgi:pyruvate formate lyase activating enzyme
LTPGKTGVCLTRKNINGSIVPLNYCRPEAGALDPIEKKPLFHFYPGEYIYSLGPTGCSFKCSFCQNYAISQVVRLFTPELTPQQIADKVQGIGMAYTFTEPYMWYETIMAVAPLIKARGMKNVMVSNGFMEPGPLAELLKVIDAMNIDIKSMNPQFYKRICKGQLDPVLRSCEQIKKAGCHLEISNLLIPGENDSCEDITKLAKFIHINLGKDTPLHIAKYYPRYRMDVPETPDSKIFIAQHIAMGFLDHVYVGNVPEDNDTICPKCGKVLIHRHGYTVVKNESCSCNAVTIIGG